MFNQRLIPKTVQQKLERKVPFNFYKHYLSTYKETYWGYNSLKKTLKRVSIEQKKMIKRKTNNATIVITGVWVYRFFLRFFTEKIGIMIYTTHCVTVNNIRTFFWENAIGRDHKACKTQLKFVKVIFFFFYFFIQIRKFNSHFSFSSFNQQIDNQLKHCVHFKIDNHRKAFCERDISFN